MSTKATRKYTSVPGSFILTAVHMTSINRLVFIFTMGEIIFIDASNNNYVEPKNFTLGSQNFSPLSAFCFGDRLFIGCQSGHICTLTFDTYSSNQAPKINTNTLF